MGYTEQLTCTNKIQGNTKAYTNTYDSSVVWNYINMFVVQVLGDVCTPTHRYHVYNLTTISVDDVGIQKSCFQVV